MLPSKDSVGDALSTQEGANYAILTESIKYRSYGHGLKSRWKPVIELQFYQIKRPGQHINYFMCTVLGKPLIPPYLHGKYLGLLSVLIS